MVDTVKKEDKKPEEPGFFQRTTERTWGTMSWLFTHATVPGMMMRSLDPGVRERNSGALNEAVKDTVRDAIAAGAWAYAKGDSQAFNNTGADVDKWWQDKITRNIGLKDFEFHMGAGWKLPKGVPYNGKLVPEMEGREIEKLDAVFVKNSNGKIEVIDHNDPRYGDIALPYVALQVASPLMVGKAISALKVVAGASKAADVISKTGKVLGTAGSVVNTVGTLSPVTKEVHSGLVLKPEAIDSIAGLIDNPNSLSMPVLRDKLNTIYHQYSYRNGPMAEQFYIPEMTKKDNPVARLQGLTMGEVYNSFESANPFDRIGSNSKPKTINLDGVTDSILEKPQFTKAFFTLAKKALTTDKLSDREIMSLRIGMNFQFRDTMDLTVGATQGNGPNDEPKYTEQDRADTLRSLRIRLSQNYFLENTKSITDPKEAQAAQFAAIQKGFREPQSGKPLLQYVEAQIKDADARISAADAAYQERQRTMSSNPMGDMAVSF